MSNIRKALCVVCLLALTHAIQAQTYNVSPTNLLLEYEVK